MKVRVGLLLWIVGWLFTPTTYADPTLSYKAAAWGSYIAVGQLVTLGLTAPAGISCGAQPGASHTNSAASVNVPSLLGVGAQTSEARAFDDATGTVAMGSNTIGAINLLGGAITADAVNAVSTTRKTAAGFETSAAGSSFVNLNVLGVPIDVDVAPNTKIDLPGGIGYIRINEQIRRQGVDSDGLAVSIIHIVITNAGVLNGISLLAGTQIYVGHASSSLAPIVGAASVNGLAYTAYVLTPLALASVGPVALIGNGGCGDTNGAILTNTTAGVALDQLGGLPDGLLKTLLSTIAGTNTVQSTVTATTADMKATSTVTALNLGGLLSVGAVKAVAHASKNATGQITLDGSESEILGVTVLGLPIPLVDGLVPKNTVLPILGLGWLWLDHQIVVGNTLYVIGVDLLLTTNNLLDLPGNTRILLGAATAAVN